MQQFGGALIEEFISGREFTVLVVEEPVAPPPGSAAAACMEAVHGGAATAAAAAAASGANGGGGAAATAGKAADGAKESGHGAVGGVKDAAADLDPDLSSFRVVAYTPVECAFGPGA